MVMHKIVVKCENGRKNWADWFLKPRPIFSKILVQVGLNFFKILVPDQNLCENFGPGPNFLVEQDFSYGSLLVDIDD